MDISATFNASTEKAQYTQGVSLQSFLASLTVSAFIFGLEMLLFILLKDRLARL